MDAQVEFAVEMKDPGCAARVEKALKDVPGIKSFDINPSSQSVLVEGNFLADKLKRAIERETGMNTVIMGQGSQNKQNFGAGVAAIAVGPSPVRGVVRATQIDKDVCIIEGTIDGFSNSNNVCVSLHETGDLSSGCESCGPVFINDKLEPCGIVNSSTPNEGCVDFRMASSQIKVADMIGRCFVVHEGNENAVKEDRSKRLACGIVARSSGLFQNSKRFCACDGLTIWEEKKKIEKEMQKSSL